MNGNIGYKLPGLVPAAQPAVATPVRYEHERCLIFDVPTRRLFEGWLAFHPANPGIQRMGQNAW